MVDLGFKASLARDRILERIGDERFQPGQQLPSERHLAEELSLNVQTIRRALAALQQDGVIDKAPRIGSFVRRVRLAATHTGIALVVPSFVFDVDTYSAVGMALDGMRRAIDQQQYVLHTLVYRPGQLWEDVGRPLRERNIRGVLLRTHHKVSGQDIARMREAGIEIVMLDHGPTDLRPRPWWVDLDFNWALEQIVTRLLERGHRRLLVARYERAHTGAVDRDVLEVISRQAGCAPFPGQVVELPNARILDVGPLQRALRGPSRPTAVVVPDETLASEVFRCCYEQNLHVPGDICVAAVHDHAPHLHAVPLTAMDVSQLTVEAATMATRHLVHALEGGALPATGLRLKHPVTWTRSIGADDRSYAVDDGAAPTSRSSEP